MWLLLAFTSAISLALQAIYIKKNSLHFNEFVITWSILAISATLYLPLFFFGNVPHLNTVFWIAVFSRLIIDSIGLVFYVKGLKIAPVSLAIPLTALVPLLLLVTQFFINHLFPTTLGIIGVCVLVGGLYLLNFDHDTKHLFSPFQSIKKSRGLQFVLIFVISQALVSSLQKLAIDNSNAYFYTAFFQLFWAILFTPLVFFYNKKEFISVFHISNIAKLFPVGGLDALQVFTNNIALVLTQPVYVYSVQNTSIILTSLFGYFFFKEKIQKHIFPTIMVVGGVILISLSS